MHFAAPLEVTSAKGDALSDLDVIGLEEAHLVGSVVEVCIYQYEMSEWA